MDEQRSGAAPAGYTSVAPWVVTDDTGAFFTFVAEAFGGEEIGRVPTEDGRIGHGEIRALDAGGTLVTPVDDDAFGQRGGRVKDPFGNIWWVTAHLEDVTEAEVWRRLGEPSYAAGMREAQETLDAELSGRAAGRSSAPVRTAG
ncbi:VOC family protein [Nocardiopsis chromatogenes]|uniref:hypothetical protein n=1 Tax=Nocardiopsis chromatogenes TaxID=280239 RepID=UPI000348965B|nr:hypothetical protein [Nocardiopsis chromatogenes]